MKSLNAKKAVPKAPRRLLSAMITAALAATGSAGAVEINTGNPDIVLRWDNTIRVNLANRVESQDAAILNSPNFDDGDRNFDTRHGVGAHRPAERVRLRLPGPPRLPRQRRRLVRPGLREPGQHHLGSSNHLATAAPRIGLSDETDRYFHGPSGEVLDAFVFGKFDVGRVPVNVKLGRHTVFWGEAMLSPVHSLSYGQSALDLGKLFSVPGTEAKELFLPREALSVQVQATPELSFAGQYFFDWEQARIPEAGSFLGFNDHLLRGGESFIFGAAPVTAANPLGVNRLVRGEDSEPDKHGDWGLSARWSPQWLDGTLGAYYRVTADILPQGNATPAVRPGTPRGACAARSAWCR